MNTSYNKEKKKEVLKELNMNSRDEALIFLKSLWTKQETLCPICGAKLEYLHKKAKKSNTEWVCKKCNKIYRTINILNKLNDENE